MVDYYLIVETNRPSTGGTVDGDSTFDSRGGGQRPIFCPIEKYVLWYTYTYVQIINIENRRGMKEVSFDYRVETIRIGRRHLQ